MRINHLVFAFLFLLFTALTAQAVPTPAPPAVKGTSHMLIDFDSGRVISSENAENRTEPASLTKMMTAYVVFNELKQGNIKLDDETVVSEKAWRKGGSKMFIEVGKKVKIEDLLRGMIIQSGNDASIALAEHIAGDEAIFASIMNTQARKLGMLNSNFENSSGWPSPNHYTTAKDMAIVAMAIIRDFPEYYPIYSEKSFTYNNMRAQQNRNLLLWRDKSVDGLKTGHTEAAGYCLVSSAKRENMRLISVVMGTKSKKARADESIKLLNYGFRFFETHKLYSAAEPLKKTRVWKGEIEQLTVGLQQDLNITIPRDKYSQLEASTRLNSQIVAPIKKHQQLGELTITLGDEIIATRPVVALRDVAESGFFSSMVDNVLMMFE